MRNKTFVVFLSTRFLCASVAKKYIKVLPKPVSITYSRLFIMLMCVYSCIKLKSHILYDIAVIAGKSTDCNNNTVTAKDIILFSFKITASKIHQYIGPPPLILPRRR